VRKRRSPHMKEARIILINESAIFDPMRNALKAIAETFGGYTQYFASGIWIDPEGNEIGESARIVDIAYEPSRLNDEKLFDIADKYREEAKQHSVYLRYGNGHVQLVTACSCMDNGEFDWDLLRKDLHRDADLIDDVPDVDPNAAVILTNNHGEPV
jgi:Protein of unknown function (DUF3574)